MKGYIKYVTTYGNIEKINYNNFNEFKDYLDVIHRIGLILDVFVLSD